MKECWINNDIFSSLHSGIDSYFCRVLFRSPGHSGSPCPCTLRISLGLGISWGMVLGLRVFEGCHSLARLVSCLGNCQRSLGLKRSKCTEDSGRLGSWRSLLGFRFGQKDWNRNCSIGCSSAESRSHHYSGSHSGKPAPMPRKGTPQKKSTRLFPSFSSIVNFYLILYLLIFETEKDSKGFIYLSLLQKSSIPLLRTLIEIENKK